MNMRRCILMTDLFERHDKSKFELIAFSFGPDSQDVLRQRAVNAFDRFIDVRSLSDRDTASLARDLEVDIAVDLKRYSPGIAGPASSLTGRLPYK